MSKVEHFEIMILGSGQGGKLLAWNLAKSGKTVAVVERQWVGGSCPAVACLPSKNEIWSARVAHLVRNASHFGVKTGAVTIDVGEVLARKRGMIEREVAFHLGAYQSSGASLVMGSGHFVGPKTIEVQLNEGGTRLLSADEIIVNVGSHAAIPAIPGLEAAKPLTHIGALDLDYAPAHLIALGGGYVGVELAQAYRRFGSRVTIVQRAPHLVPLEDADTADELQRLLRDEGIDVLTTAETVSVVGSSGESVRVTVRTPEGEREIEGSDLLVATGRVPNTAGIGLDQAGVELDERGYIRVNEYLQTTTPGIWAIGEVAGSPHFTHVSVDDFRVVRDNLTGGKHSTRDRLVPHTVFTDPPLARVGMNEREAQQKGIAVRVAKLPMSNVLRTEATDETRGFMKVLVSAEDDSIVGFSMIGSEAGEVMAVIQTAMLANLPYTRLRDAIYSHLTMAEGLGPLFANVSERKTR
ncbi:mercuric reductase [Paraburkholderia sp. 1N]|uniref:Mercuric reductase n=1 Tax=Paraburkholderia solitsugae TaxID=2675748 RepID=A0ABX2C6T3_9BURK|nr:FAD-dependent oxidoreductase [Paraburkholderia solitsugae]NPT47973.1 mercuric reductase [Paraburkholderia solitsugae]